MWALNNVYPRTRWYAANIFQIIAHVYLIYKCASLYITFDRKKRARAHRKRQRKGEKNIRNVFVVILLFQYIVCCFCLHINQKKSSSYLKKSRFHQAISVVQGFFHCNKSTSFLNMHIICVHKCVWAANILFPIWIKIVT